MRLFQLKTKGNKKKS